MHQLDGTMVDDMTDQPPLEPDVVAPAGDELARTDLASVKGLLVARVRTMEPQRVVTFVLVALSTVFVAWNVQPDLWFDDTTPTGGDMGAHVWSPAYLRDVLLPEFRLAGWSPDWYAGFPAFTFYMVVPSLLIVMVNVGLGGPSWVPIIAVGALAVIAALVRNRLGTTPARNAALFGVVAVGFVLIVPVEYGAAMKLIVVAGMVTLPIAAWSMGKLGGLAFPGPGLMAVATIPFLFDRSFNIYGGNLLSTMAGEFANSLGLTFAVVFFGVAARGMETGRHRGPAAALLALAGLTHLFAAFFSLVCLLALWLVRPGVRTTAWLAVVGPLAGLLSAFWVLPFFWNRSLLNDMGWGKERRYVAALWDRNGSFGDQTFLANDPPLQVLIVFAVLGAVLCGIRRVRFGMAMTMVALAFAALFLLLPEGRLWNVRLLPYYYLSINFMAGIAVAEIGRLLASATRSFGSGRHAFAAAFAPAALASLVVFLAFGLTLRSLPGGTVDDQGRYSWLGVFQTTERHLGPLWAAHNFNGYERTGAYPEYSLMVATMDEVGQEFGCGRALWEYQSERLGSYGTPMAPMLLPHWTDGCIGSMEGLYFEASATTPYHFLLQSELSTSPSRAQRDLPYSNLSINQGVGHLQDLGVRYYMAFTDQALTHAHTDPRLTEVATAGPWVVFLVADSDLVVGLDRMPVVVDGVQGGGEEWLVPTVGWWQAENVPLIAESGPDEWPSTSMTVIEESITALAQAVENNSGRVAEMRALAAGLPTVLPSETVTPAMVSDIVTDEFSISFEVDEIGKPVLVRTSYFPNWEATGAEGPFRVAPNLMVVVPTDTSVELSYGRSGIELVSLVLTIAGIAGLGALRRIPVLTGGRLWDLGASPLDLLPSRDLIVAEVQGARVSPASAGRLVNETAERTRTALAGLVVGLALVGVTLVLHLVVGPTTEEPLVSLLVWLPGVAGLLAVVFGHAPSLVELSRYRSTVVEPVRVYAASAATNMVKDSDGGA